jgi:Ca2+/Na+ antiporter
MTEKQIAILIQYQQELVKVQEEVKSLQDQVNKLSFSRLGIFVAMIALIFLMVQIPVLLVGLELALLLLFVFLISKQSKMQETLRFKENIVTLLQNELLHLQQGTNGYDDGLSYADARHSYSDDLDIFGPSSLYHYINRCKTNYGKDELARWLKSSDDKSAIEQRQSAVAELTDHIPHSLAIRAGLWPHPGETLPKLAKALQLDLKQFLAFTDKIWLRYYVKFLPLILLGLAGAAFFDTRFWGIFILVLILNFLLTGIFSGKINRVYSSFDQSSRKLSAYAEVFEWIEKGSWQSAYLKAFYSRAIRLLGTNLPLSK